MLYVLSRLYSDIKVSPESRFFGFIIELNTIRRLLYAHPRPTKGISVALVSKVSMHTGP